MFGPELAEIYNDEVKAYCQSEIKKMMKEHLATKILKKVKPVEP